MVFLLGVSFNESRVVKKCLESFYGIGQLGSSKILAKHHIFPNAKIGSIPSKTVTAITADLSGMKIENDLKRQLRDNIQRLRDMGAYRGRRHAMGLPVRGQRTRNQIANARYLNRIERRG